MRQLQKQKDLRSVAPSEKDHIYNMGSIVHTFFLEVKDILLIINFLVPDPSHRIPKKNKCWCRMLVQDVGAGKK